MDPAADPLTVTIVWGANPAREDRPTVRTFGSAAARAAYFKGIDEADGWMEASVTMSSGPAPSCTVRWGQNGENDEPSVYVFETQQQALAFENGVDDAVGWTQYAQVPSPDFRAANGWCGAIEHLAANGREALEQYQVGTDGGCPEHDLIFVRADGAFVDRHWTPGQPIHNVPLKPDQWRAAFDIALQAGCGQGVTGMGLDDLDLQRWSSGPMARLPAQAADAFIKHYDLQPLPAPRPPRKAGS